MASSRRLRRLKPSERLELDVDLRLSSLWSEAAGWPAWDEATLWGYLRLAYGAGYLDALTESTPGKLCLDHGLRVPPAPSSGEGWLTPAARAKLDRLPPIGNKQLAHSLNSANSEKNRRSEVWRPS
jgi:hypothetical protein